MKILKEQKGFTLLELLVAAGIFSFVVVVISGVFSQATSLQRRGSAAQKVQENAQFALELMAREIRVGEFTSAQDDNCLTTATLKHTLTIVNPSNHTITYTLVNGVIQRSDNGTVSNITSSDVMVNRLNFCIIGSGIDHQQAHVTILLGMQANSASTKDNVQFNIQTTVSLREIYSETY